MTVTIAGKRFPMIAGGADAWAPNPAADAAIVAAMRGTRGLTVAAPNSRDDYDLAGAATAIDSALIACARRQARS